MKKAMKRIPFIALLALLAEVAQAQPAPFFDRTEADLGTLLWKEPATATFTVSNRGDKPLVISFVGTDCGCTVARWTEAPIKPGESGEVTATFDAGMLGRFQKMVGIYTNADEAPYYLTLRGHVVSRLDNFDETHPHQMGNIRLDRNTVDFADSHKGDYPMAEIKIVNTGDAPYAPVMMHLPSYVRLQSDPDTLRRKQAGVLRLVLDTDKLPRMGLTQTSIYLARHMGDKVSEENEIALTATLLPDFSNLSAAERARAPRAVLSETDIDFGPFGTKKKMSRKLTLTNTGKSVLKIQELQVSNPALSVTLKKSSLEPGATTKLKVTATARYLKKSPAEARVLLITNDPDHPKLEIDVPLSR